MYTAIYDCGNNLTISDTERKNERIGTSTAKSVWAGDSMLCGGEGQFLLWLVLSWAILINLIRLRNYLPLIFTPLTLYLIHLFDKSILKLLVRANSAPWRPVWICTVSSDLSVRIRINILNWSNRSRPSSEFIQDPPLQIIMLNNSLQQRWSQKWVGQNKHKSKAKDWPETQSNKTAQ